MVFLLPIILFIFNDSNYLVLLANLLVVPLIPFAMVFAFVAGLAGTFVPEIAGWFALPARYLLTYMLDVAGIVARIPNMRFSVVISTGTMIAMYGLIMFVAFVWWNKARNNGKITDINDSNIVR